MRDVTVSGRDGGGGAPFPRTGVFLTALAVLLMLVVSAVLWSDLPAQASGSAAFGGDTSRPPRLVMALAVPGVTVMMVGCVSLGLLLGPVLDRSLGLPRQWSGRAGRAVVNAFLVLIAVFLLAMHTVLLHVEADRALFLPLERLLILLTAGFLAGFGLLVGLMRTPARKDHMLGRWWDRARRPVGAAVVAVGALVAVAGWLLPEAVYATPLVGLLVPAILLGCVVPLIGDQSWKLGDRSGR
ncbi:hypothetical protein DFP74_1717 [Nocardiopsis sp. Huas11]|uniref:hypothetical protein n=1 Tax=Nocardiopsis sp. Huas11 TaxID=2183912 RepID=UPI000F1F72F5|nr:hypothetical protein [Nocardiopsis sp. Huas11]RKS06094.1 hypothetical protein DFP74_1717 [Nocardiopsis sp. Huas11]